MKKMAFLFMVIFLLFTFYSGCLSLRVAYIHDKFLNNGWIEDTGSEEEGSSLLGLEKWITKIYRKGDFAYLSLTSLKFIIVRDKNKLIEDVEEDIKQQAFKYGIAINMSSKICGQRKNAEGHDTRFVVFNGEKDGQTYKFIGEVWTCSKSGISVICMGFADVSEFEGIIGWREMVGDPKGTIEGINDPDGLIYNVVCH